MADLIVITLLGIAVVLCTSSIVWHRRQGELCECTGDCEHCRIRCCSNERLYGSAAAELPPVRRGTPSRSESHLSVALYRIRYVIDLICYWIFNLVAIIALARGIVVTLAGLLD